MEIPTPKFSTTMLPKDFFGKLFQIRDGIHLRHLYPTSPKLLGSGWEHKALNDFYESILDLTDGLIESYQGKYGLIDITIPSTSKMDSISTLKELAKLTDDGKAYSLFKESWIKNQLDEISKLTYQTLYKLENLK